MSRSPLSAREEQSRLAALRAHAVLDTAPEERFDEVTRLAALVCDAPVALVSLVDEHRQWFKSRVGLDVVQTPREHSFCAHALGSEDGLLVVPDATADPRFADNPLVTGPMALRAYAGAPLVMPDGSVLGSLCVLDTRPRAFTDAQREALATLGRSVVAHLELRLAGRLPVPSPRVPAPADPDRAELERALRDGELVVHLQPFYDVTVDGRALAARLSGAESLVRWQHPERGLVPPVAFVPAMERLGLATELGETVLRQSLTHLARWEADGLLPPSFRLHVNVAAAQLHEGGMVDLLDGLARDTGAPLHRLCLEVTESALLDASAFTPAQAQRIVDRGVRLALDDFGTGFSSLTQLRSYPFSGVKVDRSFVAGLGVSPQDEVIVDTVVSMAHRLGIEPVCEGVETPAQLERVVDAGCTTVQGWLFGRATPPDHWEAEVLREPPQVLLRTRSGRPSGPVSARALQPVASLDAC